MNKVATIKYQGNDYATVPARLKEFRQNNPNGSVKTVPMYQPDGSLIIQATIIQDRSNEYSADATGTARYSSEELEKKKSFEKLETIAVGRALALLGYLNNGEIATTEEMDEFNDFQNDKYEKLINEATKREEFLAILTKMNPEQKKHFTPMINKRIQELKDAVPAN